MYQEKGLVQNPSGAWELWLSELSVVFHTSAAQEKLI